MQNLIKAIADKKWKKVVLIVISAVLAYYNIEL